MQVIFSPQARQEFDQAERYYAHLLAGLGAAFRREIKSALARIEAWPQACPLERGDIRRMTLSRFPYKLLYSVESEYIYILAVAHQHRAPDYWAERGGEI